MKVLASTKDMTRAEWLNYRKLGIGGSEIASILGVSPFSNAYAVWLQKTNTEDNSNFDNDAMYWGRKLEDIVADEFSVRTGLKIKRRNAILVHDKYDFLMANVDRLIIGAEEGLEVKTAGEYAKTEWQDGNIPYHYYLQIQHYMLVTGYKHWWVAVLIGGNDFRYKKVERDEQTISLILEKCTDFWNNYVMTKTPPHDAKWVDDLYKLSTENTTTIDTDDLIIKLEETKAEIKMLEKEAEQIENELKMQMKDNETLISPSYKATWKTTFTKRLDTKKLQDEHSELCKSYIVDSSYRKFMIKKLKGGK
jgi:putative phage-type endonuclease